MRQTARSNIKFRIILNIAAVPWLNPWDSNGGRKTWFPGHAAGAAGGRSMSRIVT
jgi:hypothetical protein